LKSTKQVSDIEQTFKKRWLLFTGWVALASTLFGRPLIALFQLSVSTDDLSYLVLIPFISAYVFSVERRKIFQTVSYDAMVGCSLLLAAVCVAVSTSLTGSSSVGPGLSGYILALVILWMAGFSFLFGRAASKAGYFPLLFLLLMVPFPQSLLDRVIYILQTGSAWTTGALFDVFGVPSLRDGFVFHLARIDIEVAKECSGIRSSMVLLILALIVSHFFLKRFWSKALFVVCGLFMMMLKNGIRIASLTLLAMYVNPSFLTGRLHHQGGIVFFILGLLLLLPVLWILQRGDGARCGGNTQPAHASPKTAYVASEE
jgi:exosortase